MQSLFNLTNFFADSFGYQPPENFPDVIETGKTPYIPTKPEAAVTTKLGHPFFNQANEDFYGREYFLPVYLDDYIIPMAVIAATSKKTIIKTPLVECGGSVKDNISFEDYIISIKGITISDDSSFPEEEMQILQNIFKKAGNVELRSALTEILFTDANGGRKVVIRDMRWVSKGACEHARAFEITCEYDPIQSLEIE